MKILKLSNKLSNKLVILGLVLSCTQLSHANHKNEPSIASESDITNKSIQTVIEHYQESSVLSKSYITYKSLMPINRYSLNLSEDLSKSNKSVTNLCFDDIPYLLYTEEVFFDDALAGLPHKNIKNPIPSILYKLMGNWHSMSNVDKLKERIHQDIKDVKNYVIEEKKTIKLNSEENANQDKLQLKKLNELTKLLKDVQPLIDPKNMHYTALKEFKVIRLLLSEKVVDYCASYGVQNNENDNIQKLYSKFQLLNKNLEQLYILKKACCPQTIPQSTVLITAIQAIDTIMDLTFTKKQNTKKIYISQRLKALKNLKQFYFLFIYYNDAKFIKDELLSKRLLNKKSAKMLYHCIPFFPRENEYLMHTIMNSLYAAKQNLYNLQADNPILSLRKMLKADSI